MSDNKEPEERVQPASGVSSRMPGETNTEGSVGGAVTGAGPLDELGETDAPGESGVASGGDSLAGDDEQDRASGVGSDAEQTDGSSDAGQAK